MSEIDKLPSAPARLAGGRDRMDARFEDELGAGAESREPAEIT